ncbi:plasmid mobilization protein [Chitinophaga lutea]
MTTIITKKKAGGRPVSARKKKTIIRVRFDRDQYFILRHKSQKAGLNFSAYLRQAAEATVIKARLTPEERDFIRKLVGMANNLNQLIKEFKQAGILKTAAHVEGLRDKVDQLLKLLRGDK